MSADRSKKRRSTVSFVGAVGCLLLYAYASWAALTSYRFRHFDPQWQFAQGQWFLVTYDVLFTFAPIAVVTMAFALFVWRRRYAMLGAVIANSLIATNAVAPVIKERLLLDAHGIPTDDRFPIQPIAVLVIAVTSLLLVVIGSRPTTSVPGG